MTFNLPSEKGSKIQQQATNLLKSQSISARHLAAFIGKVVAASRAVVPQPVLVIESDASQLGWGARCMKASMGGHWSVEESTHHINYLELLAAFLALKTFANTQKGPILLRMDNISAVTHINQKGGTHSTQLSNLALEVWKWCLQRQLTIQAEHLPGSLNLVVDSRVQNDEGSVRSNDKSKNFPASSVSRTITNRSFCISPDKTATPLRQLEAGSSCRSAEATDAFTQNWAQARGFANSPWFLISHCRNQRKQQQARVLVVKPLRPYQLWYPIILRMLEDYPRQLPQIQDIILNPTNQEFIMK